MNVTREKVSLALFNLLAASTILAPSEPWNIPSSSPYTVNVLQQQLWASDAGVTYANGTALTKVGSNPSTGQYAVASGVYTFAVGDEGAAVLISYNYNWAFTSRGLQLWTKDAVMPALWLHGIDEDDTQDMAPGLTRYELRFLCVCYATRQTGVNGPTNNETILNTMTDAIDGAIQAKPKGIKQTLGGIVNSAWINGRINRVGGIVSEQVSLTIPITVETSI